MFTRPDEMNELAKVRLIKSHPEALKEKEKGELEMLQEAKNAIKKVVKKSKKI